jgi:hypothetical protein
MITRGDKMGLRVEDIRIRMNEKESRKGIELRNEE